MVTRMYAPLLRLALFRERQLEVAEQSAVYAQGLSRTEIERRQVSRFNEVWKYCLTEVPFYQAWAKEHGLPSRVGSLAEIQAFPLLTKADIVGRTDEVFQGGKITAAYSTGGSSGAPARYPRGDGDALSLYANTYAGRGWWGIRPFDSYLHLWGHAHLFGGGGVSGVVQKAKRKAADALANATRVNAYDMTPDALQSHYAALVRSNPAYIVGYTSAVFKLARHIETMGVSVAGLTKLRAVVVTSETVTGADVELTSRVFGVPVVIEYGAAETGVMATSHGGSWPLRVLWQSFIMSVNDGDIAVTTLNDRLFPLINYAIGDMAEGGDISAGNALTLGTVTGRSTDTVRFGRVSGGGIEVNALLPIHILKGEPGVTAVQLRQESPSNLRVFLSADHDINMGRIAETFTIHMLGEYPEYDPDSVHFEQAPAPVLTKAGKQALFV